MIVSSDRKNGQPHLPALLQDVALIDADACAAVGSVSLSWWHAEVAAGRAPKPVVQRPRHTRWRVAAVAEFWRQFAETGLTDTEASQAVRTKAENASLKARAPAAVAKARATRASNIAKRVASSRATTTSGAHHD